VSHRPGFESLVNEAKRNIQEVSPQQAAKMRAEGAVLIDVREADEFAKEHATGAIHLSKGVLEWKIEEQIPDPATTIVCYCGGGSRSALAAESLKRMGYSKAVSVTGGFKAWRDQSLPVES
jgi:phage shock protein E